MFPSSSSISITGFVSSGVLRSLEVCEMGVA